jgi:hypothetical protein
VIAECCLSDTFALAALCFRMRFVMTRDFFVYRQFGCWRYLNARTILKQLILWIVDSAVRFADVRT